MNTLTIEELLYDNDRLKVRNIALSKSYSQLRKFDSPCECCKNMSESIDSLEYQVEQFKLRDVQLKIALKNLQEYHQVEAI